MVRNRSKLMLSPSSAASLLVVLMPAISEDTHDVGVEDTVSGYRVGVGHKKECQGKTFLHLPAGACSTEKVAGACTVMEDSFLIF